MTISPAIFIFLILSAIHFTGRAKVLINEEFDVVEGVKFASSIAMAIVAVVILYVEAFFK